MIAEVVPMIETTQTAPDDLEQVVRAAELAAIEAHRLAAEGLRRRARWLAARVQRGLEEGEARGGGAGARGLEGGQGPAGATVGPFVHNTDAALRMRLCPESAASHARAARSCARA